MEPASRLTAISGPLKGQSFLMEVEEISLGRGSSCVIRIPDSAISRKHCVIQKNADGYRIVDLKSLNGTFVNGIPIEAHLLQEGNQIELGESIFVYIRASEQTAVQPEVRILPELVLNSTQELLPSEGLFLNSQKLRSTNYGKTDELQTLLIILTSIQNIQEPHQLYEKLATLLPLAVPLSRATMLLHHGSCELRPVMAFTRKGLSNEEMFVSKNVAQKVLANAVGLLCDTKTSPSRSASVICVPLSCFGKTLGVLYVESDKQLHSKHLELLTAIGNVCAVTLRQMLRIENLQTHNLGLEAELNARQTLVGTSSAMCHVHQLIARVAPTSSTVLILGETGTGKEVAARAIHRNSKRTKQPFIAINCAAIPDSLMESELFGYLKGAFTGALHDKKGKIELANEGTLFLDEIADLSPVLQAKLLRVIQERELERLGASDLIPIDIRLIAATNRDLKQAVRRGKFRADLYHRLNVFVVELPPLRNRKEDITLLANHLLHRLRCRIKKEVLAISNSAISALLNYHWPGNVRELENALERAMIMTNSSTISVEDLPDFVLRPEDAHTHMDYQSSVDHAKRQAILVALTQSGGNYTKAAEILGLQRTYLHQLIRKFKIKRHDIAAKRSTTK